MRYALPLQSGNGMQSDDLTTESFDCSSLWLRAKVRSCCFLPIFFTISVSAMVENRSMLIRFEPVSMRGLFFVFQRTLQRDCASPARHMLRNQLTRRELRLTWRACVNPAERTPGLFYANASTVLGEVLRGCAPHRWSLVAVTAPARVAHGDRCAMTRVRHAWMV